MRELVPWPSCEGRGVGSVEPGHHAISMDDRSDGLRYIRWGHIRCGDVIMNRRLEEAIARVEALPDDRQGEAAEVLFAFLDTHVADIH